MKRILFTILLMLMVTPAKSISVRETLLGNIDGTVPIPPSTLSLPSSGSLIATNGAQWIDKGSSIAGVRMVTGNTNIVISTDNGVTWTEPGSPVFNMGYSGFIITDTGTWIHQSLSGNGYFPGLWRSINAGVTWTAERFCAPCSAGTPVAAVAQDPAGGRIWAITKNDDNFVTHWQAKYSDDDGDTWITSAIWDSSGWLTGSFRGMLVDGNTVIATSSFAFGASGGIYTTTNNGTSWTKTTFTVGGLDPTMYLFPVKAGNTYYVIAKNNAITTWGIFKSTDGVTWTKHLESPNNCRYNLEYKMINFNDNVDDYLFIGCSKTVSPYNITIYYMKLPGTDMVEVYDTGISGGSVSLGNLLFINSTLYFGMDNGNFYKVE